MLPYLKRIPDSRVFPYVLQTIKYGISRLHLLVLPFLLLAFFEYLVRDNVKAMLNWSWQQPHPFWLNYWIIVGLLLLFAGIFGRTWRAYLALSLVLTIIGFVSGVKLKLLGAPLMPWDVLLGKETEAVSTYLTGIWDWQLAGWGLLFIVLSVGLITFVPRFNVRFKWQEQVLFVLVASLIGSSVYWGKPFNLMDRYNIFNVTWDQAQNYKLNGFMVSTAMNLKLAFVPQPKDYSEAQMNAIIQTVPRRTNIDTAVKPNIIVILSESLWDPTLLPKATFSEDPLPTLHQMMKDYSSGWMLSPQFGGGTANVEFEVLSGNSMRFTPPGSTPYIQYMNHGTDSLASILARQGYTTTAINPFFNWFYNSKNVYKNLGFSQFISMEFMDQNFKGGNISDHTVAQTIIDQTKRSKGPDFVFSNTMENHQPYNPGKFYSDPIQVGGDLTALTKGTLQSYVTGANDADQMLKKLVDYYTAAKEPTILVFFGDHKPILGSNYGVYNETGYFKPNETEHLRKMYNVPVVVWDNYLPKHKENLDISPAFLGPYVLNLAQKEGTPYTDYLYALSQKVPILPPSNYYDAFHIKSADLEPYRLFQYDMMFGKQYSLQQVKEPIVSPAYKLGFGKMVIDSILPAQITAGVNFQDEMGQSILIVSGQNIVPKSVVYLNDQPMDTVRTSEGRLKAVVPNSLFAKPGNLKLELKVLDSENIVVSDSNTVNIEVKK